MNYASIKKTDIANGPGVRVSLFVSGCTHHCKECFNPETWNFAYGEQFDEKVQEMLLRALAPSHIQGLTLLGGEPMEPENQRGLLPFVKRVREEYPQKSIWCFTGYTLETDLLGVPTDSQEGCGRARCEVTDEFLSNLDVLVDGEFQIAKKDIRLKFRGSSNQRILDIPASLEHKKGIWMEEYR